MPIPNLIPISSTIPPLQKMLNTIARVLLLLLSCKLFCYLQINTRRKGAPITYPRSVFVEQERAGCEEQADARYQGRCPVDAEL